MKPSAASPSLTRTSLKTTTAHSGECAVGFLLHDCVGLVDVGDHRVLFFAHFFHWEQPIGAGIAIAERQQHDRAQAEFSEAENFVNMRRAKPMTAKSNKPKLTSLPLCEQIVFQVSASGEVVGGGPEIEQRADQQGIAQAFIAKVIA